MIILLITGSRSITRPEDVEHQLVSFYEKHKDQEITMFQGDASGVDTICKKWAWDRGHKVRSFPITDEDWQKMPKYAGNMRNEEMLREALEATGCQVECLAFWDGGSTGTKDMIDRCRKANVNWKIVLVGKSKSKRLFP